MPRRLDGPDKGLPCSGSFSGIKGHEALYALRQLSLDLRGPSGEAMDGPHACGCGAPDEPCPVCNRVEGDQVPEMLEGFVADTQSKDWD